MSSIWSRGAFLILAVMAGGSAGGKEIVQAERAAPRCFGRLSGFASYYEVSIGQCQQGKAEENVPSVTAILHQISIYSLFYLLTKKVIKS